MDATTRGLAVGLEIDGDGAHPAAWRYAAHPPDELLTPARLAGTGHRAEAAGYTFVTLDDRAGADPGAGVAGRFDPVTAAAFLSAHTSAPGLVPVVPTAHAEPFHVSNQLSGLDHGSAGRAGWLAVGGESPERSAAYAVRHESAPAVLAGETGDVVRAARWLWDSWQDDAIIADEATGRFLDADRVHHVDFRGRTFSVRGPALVPRPPQGQVPVFAPAGTLAPDLVDVGIVTAPDVDGLLAADPGAARSLAEIEIVLDTPDAPAADRLAALDRHARWPAGRRLRHVGDADGLVALLRTLAARFDAVRLLPAVLDVDGAVLAGRVLPALGSLLHRPVPGATLRDAFGLPRPAGRFDPAGQQAAPSDRAS
ncbi:LLM class flavin-dependent oxidoreductase [Pseudonocardia sp. NPDC046786]|uniref:LLM class flavin-dependent oxidoreductase n=1 Tax=Pseudonocardia sp. NPDC046786 TaxID=3155471 RepID=UPI0033F62FE5